MKQRQVAYWKLWMPKSAYRDAQINQAGECECKCVYLQVYLSHNLPQYFGHGARLEQEHKGYIVVPLSAGVE